jgi:serine/threonine-protein kinase RsbW
VFAAETGAVVVEIRISARPALIPTVRAVASDVAGRADFDLDAISDLRMAVDEACTTLVEMADPDSTLNCLFQLDPDRIQVTVSIASAVPGAQVRTDSFGWRVLQTLADEVSTDQEGRAGALSVTLVKRASTTR